MKTIKQIKADAQAAIKAIRAERDAAIEAVRQARAEANKPIELSPAHKEFHDFIKVNLTREIIATSLSGHPSTLSEEDKAALAKAIRKWSKGFQSTDVEAFCVKTGFMAGIEITIRTNEQRAEWNMMQLEPFERAGCTVDFPAEQFVIAKNVIQEHNIESELIDQLTWSDIGTNLHETEFFSKLSPARIEAFYEWCEEGCLFNAGE